MAKTLRELTSDWRRAVSFEESMQRQLATAEAQRKTTAEALAKVLVPDDMELGEKIGTWVRLEDKLEALLVIQKVDGKNYTLKLRSKRDEVE